MLYPITRQTKNCEHMVSRITKTYNKSLHLTAIPLRSMAAGELGRSSAKRARPASTTLSERLPAPDSGLA